MNTLLGEENIISREDELINYFKSGFKLSKKIGFEYEKLPVTKNFSTPDFFFDNGMLDFLIRYQEKEKLVPYYENDIMLGLYSNNNSVSLEPGCQLELSLKPFEKISDIEKELNIYNRKTAEVAQELGIKFLALGNQPFSTYSNIKIIPKERYKFMTEYFKTQGLLAYVMMRETAGTQVSIDYSDEEDAIAKLSCALKLSPFLSALFVNSPIRNGEFCGYKSFRMNAWLHTDNNRCGLISNKLLNNECDFCFSDYVNILLDVPMIFENENYLGNKTFREYLKENKVIKEKIWETHLSLVFPDVRLKNYIEIRNHDCQKIEYTLAIPSIYNGIMYYADGIRKINELLKEYTYLDYEYIRQNAPKCGIDLKINKKSLADILKDIILIAKEGLREFCLDEDKYIEPIEELLHDNMTPADIIIKNFNGSWNKNINKLIEFSEIKG